MSQSRSLYAVARKPAVKPSISPLRRGRSSLTKPASQSRRSAATMTEPGEPKLLLTVDEAGARLGFGRRTVYSMIRRGDIITVRVGRYRRVPVAALEAWIAQLIEDQTS